MPDRIDAARTALIVYDACRRALTPAAPARRQAMGEEGRRRVADFSWERAAAQAHAMFHERETYDMFGKAGLGADGGAGGDQIDGGLGNEEIAAVHQDRGSHRARVALDIAADDDDGADLGNGTAECGEKCRERRVHASTACA